MVASRLAVRVPRRAIWPPLIGWSLIAMSTSTVARDMAADDRRNWMGTAGEFQ